MSCIAGFHPFRFIIIYSLGDTSPKREKCKDFLFIPSKFNDDKKNKEENRTYKITFHTENIWFDDVRQRIKRRWWTENTTKICWAFIIMLCNFCRLFNIMYSFWRQQMLESNDFLSANIHLSSCHFVLPFQPSI